MHSGLTPSEAAIIDLWDAGDSIQQIQRKLNMRGRRVANVVSDYHQADDEARNRRMMARGSTALLDAICQYRNAMVAR